MKSGAVIKTRVTAWKLQRSGTSITNLEWTTIPHKKYPILRYVDINDIAAVLEEK
jgi:hypothetical protein